MKKPIIAFALSTLFSSTLSAAVITYENRVTDSGVDNSDYQASWSNQSSTIQSRDLDEFTNLTAIGPNKNQQSHLSISFDVSADNAGQDWWFQFSPDAGLGGEVYFDGALVERTSDNLWWGGNWNNINELLEASIADLDAGSHTIDLYWAENCCNGGQSGRFSVDNGDSWYTLSTENLNAVGVPEPGTFALMALGVAGLVLTRRKQK